MRIAGYVRQTPGRSDPDSAFAQSERIRRWVLDTGHELIAVCQDHHTSVSPTERPGFRALLDIVRNDGADAVLVASLDALSPDMMMQEIMLVDIRAAGCSVIATGDDDIAALTNATDDHARMVVRDTVAKLHDYSDAYGLSGINEPTVQPASLDNHISEATDTTDVVIELIAPSNKG
ncbi:MAG: recombinase family protein [Actinomycetia bacterium]|nr:recombinase family protein [Actinomycetes bacterium]